MEKTPEIYRKYITVNKRGETVIYVKVINTIDGIMKEELLFYKNLLVV